MFPRAVRFTLEPNINEQFPADFTNPNQTYIGSIGFAGSFGAWIISLNSDDNGVLGPIGFLGTNFPGEVGILAGTVDENGFVGSIGWVDIDGFIGEPSDPDDPNEPGADGFTGSVGFTGSQGTAGSSPSTTIGAAGTYALLGYPSGSPIAGLAPGDTIAGSAVKYSNVPSAGASIQYSSISPSGTWQCMGYLGGSIEETTLFLRIA